MTTISQKAAAPEVFTRKASGLVRVMSPYSAFVYNILTMGLIFPWTYLWAPGALPPALVPYVALLRGAEALVFVFPVWCFGVPAILKGFFDRVFRNGVSFELEGGTVVPKLQHVSVGFDHFVRLPWPQENQAWNRTQ